MLFWYVLSVSLLLYILNLLDDESKKVFTVKMTIIAHEKHWLTFCFLFVVLFAVGKKCEQKAQKSQYHLHWWLNHWEKERVGCFLFLLCFLLVFRWLHTLTSHFTKYTLVGHVGPQCGSPFTPYSKGHLRTVNPLSCSRKYFDIIWALRNGALSFWKG